MGSGGRVCVSAALFDRCGVVPGHPLQVGDEPQPRVPEVARLPVGRHDMLWFL